MLKQRVFSTLLILALALPALTLASIPQAGATTISFSLLATALCPTTTPTAGR